MKVISIGRSPDNNVVIQNSTVSRHHAQIIQHNDGRFSIVNLNSKNGTLVNGKYVYNSAPLVRGDIVTVGTVPLSWENYFNKTSTSTQQKSNALLLILGTAGGVLITILTVVLLITGGGGLLNYDTHNVNAQVMVSFSEDISFSEANSWLKKHHAKVIESDFSYGYFLVCTRNEKSAKSLITKLNASGITDCAICNQHLIPQSVKLSVLDVFGEPMSSSDSISHGQMVTYTMTKGTNLKADQFQIKVDGHISSNEMTSDFIKACDQMSDKDLNIINFSLGVSRYKDAEQKKEMERSEFLDAYADDIRWYANLANKCGKKNFIITKSMGNESEHHIDEAFELALDKMTDDQRKALKNHMILVAAKDTRKHVPRNYSNTISQKTKGVNTIMVDLSELPIAQRGTSAAAPLVANWIAKSGLENASDVIKTINQVTKDGELVSEQAFNNTVQNVVSQNISHEKPTPAIHSQSFYTKLNEDVTFTLDDGSHGTLRLFTFGLGDLTFKIYWSGKKPIDVHWRLDGYGLAPSSGNLSCTHNKYAYEISHTESFRWTNSNADARGIEVIVTPRY